MGEYSKVKVARPTASYRTALFFFEDGKLRIEEGDYVRSGWDVRNMRFNDFGTGQHLFPNTDRPVVNLDDDSVRVFLQRIENVRGCLASQIQFCSITAGLQMRLLGGEVPQ